MALYPNPANNTLYVSGTDDKNVVVSIYNEVGQIVTTLSSNGETIRTGGIDVSQLTSGCIQHSSERGKWIDYDEICETIKGSRL
jgi:hypothetical protein